MLEIPLWFLCWWPMLPHSAEDLGYSDFFCTRSVCGLRFSWSETELEQFPRRRAGWPVWENQGEGGPSEIKTYVPIPCQGTGASLSHKDNVVVAPAPTMLWLRQLPGLWLCCCTPETSTGLAFTLETVTNHVLEWNSIKPKPPRQKVLENFTGEDWAWDSEVHWSICDPGQAHFLLKPLFFRMAVVSASWGGAGRRVKCAPTWMVHNHFGGVDWMHLV